MTSLSFYRKNTKDMLLKLLVISKIQKLIPLAETYQFKYFILLEISFFSKSS